MNSFTNMQNVLDTSTCIYSHKDILAAFDKMAEKINCHPLCKENPVFIGVAVGGLLPLANLTLRLKFPLELDFAHVSSYKDKMYASELQWKTKPHINLKDRVVVIVDDILDKGLTLSELVSFCKKEQARAVYTAVLINKKVERSSGGLADADFIGLDIEDKFVFGYGLDYKGFWRNAPGIYEPSEEYKK